MSFSEALVITTASTRPDTSSRMTDGWSGAVMLREIALGYAALATGAPFPFPPLAAQYADYAERQRATFGGDAMRASIDYWRAALDGVATLELPSDRPRPAVADHAGARVPFAIDAPLFHSAHYVNSFAPRRFTPGVLMIEERFPQAVRDELARRGHRVHVQPPWSLGRLCAAGFTGSGLVRAAATPRFMQAYAVGR